MKLTPLQSHLATRSFTGWLRIFGALLLLTLTGCSRADEFAEVQKEIQHYVTDERVPSIAVALVKGDHIEWEQAFGWADLDKKVPTTVHTPYMLGSLSKPVTATAVMLLAERGRLDIDRPVNDYLGQETTRGRLGDARAVTARRLMQHTSGLPNYLETFYADESGSPPTFLSLMALYGSTMVPQERFHYSNLGYIVLSELIAQVSGKSFPKFVREDVFAPLGMADSFVPTGPKRRDNAAVRYFNGVQIPDYVTRVVPAADIHASVYDLALFAMMQMKSTSSTLSLLSAKSINQMQESTVPIKGWKYDYANGWAVAKDHKGRRQVFHGGSSAGCDTFLTMLPDERVAASVLINGMSPGQTHLVSQDIAAQVLAVALGEDPKDPELDLEQEKQQLLLPGDLVGSWKGLAYADEEQLPVTIRFGTNGDVVTDVGDSGEEKVDSPRFVTEVFVGGLDHQLQTKAARRRPRKLTWDLRLVNGRLVGVLYAYSTTERGMLLPYAVELRR